MVRSFTVGGIEGRILEAWQAERSALHGTPERERLYGLLIQWVKPRLVGVPSGIRDDAYDSFVDRVLRSFPRSTPSIGLLKACWRRSCVDASRRARHGLEQSMTDGMV